MVTVEITRFIEGYNTITLTYDTKLQLTISYNRMKLNPAFSEITFHSTAGMISTRIQDKETYRAVQAYIKGDE